MKLLNELVPQAQAIKTKSISKRLAALGKHMLGTLVEIRDSLKMDIKEIEEKIKENERKRTEIVRNISRKTDEVMENIRAAVREACGNFETKAYASVESYVDRVIKSGSADPFVFEMRRLWELESVILQKKIKEQLSDYGGFVSSNLDEVEVANFWWVHWIDIAVVVLTTIIGPLTGFWTLLEAAIGKGISETLKRFFGKGIVRSALNTAVQKIVSNLQKEMNSKLEGLRSEAKEHIAEEMEPLLRETEEALSELKSRKEKEVFDFEEEKRSLNEDISRLERAIQQLA